LLLIINIYQISNLLKYYKILYKYSFTSNDTKTAQVILEIISLIHWLHADIHKKSIKNIETKDIESSYMMCDIKNNKLSFSAIKVVSDNNKEHMYKKILIKNFNI
jgi:hypothetical protein